MTPTTLAVAFWSFVIGYLVTRILNNRRRPADKRTPLPRVSHWPRGHDNRDRRGIGQASP